MTGPVDLVTVHHEGAGAPCPISSSGRFAPGGYTYGICTDGWAHFRDVWDSYATLNFNHVSLDLCIAGNRMDYPVSSGDVETIRSAVDDARKRGYVVNAPLVRAHRNSPGSSTVCPGDHTMQVWDQIVNACQAGHTPPPEPPKDEDMDLACAINHDNRPVIFQVGGDKRLYFRIRDAQGGDWSDWRDLSAGKTGFAAVTSFVNPANKRIEVWATLLDGHTFNRWQTGDDYAGWSSWVDQTR